MSATIPRFLLPQSGAIWRRVGIASPSRAIQSVRNASHKVTPKPQQRVLEKPAKFNPPSHGARLRKDPPKYPGPALSAEQAEAQKTKKYPNMMPPEGSFLHWFLNNRSIHVYITLGTLFSMAGYTWITNFKRTSKFADMLPSASDLFFHPIAFIRTFLEVLKLHSAAMTAETVERRRNKVDDVAKRAEYRKAHGLETEGFGGWTAKTDEQSLGPAIPTVDGDTREVAVQEHLQHRKPIKKWLGIW